MSVCVSVCSCVWWGVCSYDGVCVLCVCCAYVVRVVFFLLLCLGVGGVFV